ncbi:MAG: DUF983 domain-containing protein [Proteobacteria bacterium]|nr:DUF983 domain-containing protein [Pseudomonadota bacterium]
MDYPEVSPFQAGLTCRCPRCGRGPLYTGFLTVRGRCETCDLDLSAQDSGDGPAALIILFLGFAIVGVAIWVEMSFAPPYWLHVVLWPPIIMIATVGLLRPLKAFMVAQQFRHRRDEFDERS